MNAHSGRAQRNARAGLSTRSTAALSSTRVLLLLSAAACHPKPAAQPAENPERTGLVAQLCPEIVFGAEPVDANNARVFVEVVEVSASELPNPVGAWLQQHPVTVRSSANLVAFPNVPTSMPWGQCVDAVCTSAQRVLTLTARLPALGTDPIELGVRIDASPQQADTPASQALLDTTLHVKSQEPLALPSNPQLSSGSLVVTAYLLRKLDDLQRLLECKVHQGEREKKLQ